MQFNLKSVPKTVFEASSQLTHSRYDEQKISGSCNSHTVGVRVNNFVYIINCTRHKGLAENAHLVADTIPERSRLLPLGKVFPSLTGLLEIHLLPAKPCCPPQACVCPFANGNVDFRFSDWAQAPSPLRLPVMVGTEAGAIRGPQGSVLTRTAAVALGVTGCAHHAHPAPGSAPAARPGRCTRRGDAVGAPRRAHAGPAAAPAPARRAAPGPGGRGGGGGPSCAPTRDTRPPAPPANRSSGGDQGRRHVPAAACERGPLRLPAPPLGVPRAPHPAPRPSPSRPHAGAPGPSHPPPRGARAGAGRPSEGAWPPAPTRARALAPYGYVSGHVTTTPQVPREATGR